jgi:predicted O-methyltransferase YrrM
MSEKTYSSIYQEIVVTLYKQLLDRRPGAREEAYWLEYVQKNSFAATYEAFLKSAEFKARQGAKPGHPVGHFYSPVVDPAIIDPAKLEVPLSQGALDITGLSLSRMKEFWFKHLGTISSATFPRSATAGRRYYLENPVFSFADALMLRTMLIVHKPKRVIEVGSGFSSAVMLDTIDEANLQTKLEFIDPYPAALHGRLLTRDQNSKRIEIIDKPIQDVDLTIFSSLGADDILFIDSTHVLKSQSDVCREFFDIFPLLKKGVIIHLHDIFYPFEYPRSWLLDLRYSWNEIYGLRLFLMYNTSFETIFFNNMFGKLEEKVVRSTCPLYMENIGGSFWMRKLTG